MDLMNLVATLSLDASDFSKGLDLAGDLMQKFASAVVGFGKDVINTGMGFDKQMSAVQAVLGKTEGTMENMERLRGFALEQAHDSIFTAEQTGQAYYYMGMAGWKTEQMLTGLPGVMNLAAASGEDLGRVSDIVTDSITAFGLTANDVTSYVDILAQTATNANTDVSRMGETFKYVAPIAGQLGFGVDDVAVSIGLMANAGIKGGMAGTALRNIFTRISTDAGATSKQLGALGIMTEKLGVQFYDSEGNARDWSTVLGETREAWKGLSQEEQIAYAKTIASQRGMAGWLALMNASEEDFEQLTKSIEESTGAAQEMADVKLDNLWGDTVKFNSALDVLKVAIFDDVKGPMREIVQDATTSIDNIRDAIEKDGLTGGIEQVGTEIERLSEKFQPILESLGKALVPVITTMIETVAESTGPIIKLGVAIGEGIMEGITQALQTTDNPLFQSLAKILGLQDNSMGLLGGVFGSFSMPEEQIAEINALGPVEIPVKPEIEGGAESIREAIAKAAANGFNTVEIDGEILTLKDAAQLATDIENGAAGAGAAIATDIGTDLSGVDTSGMESKIGSAGTTAGPKVASAIQTALSLASFAISVKANVSGLPTEHNARAMNVGRIFRNPTIFGAAQGALQMAGDAGPEAVVGTNSLTHMIREAVAYGMRSYAVSAPSAPVSAQPIVLQVNGKTLGRVMAGDNAAAAAGYNKSIAMGYGG